MKIIEIKTESFEGFESLLDNKETGLNWNCLFVLPVWLKAWWEIFGDHKAPEIMAGYQNGKLIGIAPLRVEEETARFIGGEDVCDYQDAILSPEPHPDFFKTLLSHLKTSGVRYLELGDLRPESRLLREMPELAARMGYTVCSDQAAFSYEIPLPKTWESYLQMLNGKQRHEIRRKTRRLNEAGNIRFRVMSRPDEISEAMNLFFSMFRASRPDKTEFLTDQMASFFLLVAKRMARHGFLRMLFLEIDQVPAAGVMCFDFNDTVYLYNNGFNPRFGNLSVGLLGKVYSIRDSIERGRRTYDLLKGDEAYKKRLGGTPVPLYRLKIDLER
ncbi:MAG: GNAT family N-acetyltransferase [Deltaproteobacteria bacterium]|nr:GNAT family N-acetyltransferase [Deltaproteobacteria bacterium]